MDLPNITDEQREFFQRIFSGEHDNDLIRRGDVYDAIRTLRLTDVSSQNPIYQHALSDVQRAICKL